MKLTAIVVGLSILLGSPVPSKIDIEIVSQAKMQSIFKEDAMSRCMNGEPTAFPRCSEYVQTLRVFVYGMWVREKDPKHFHIRMSEGAGVNVLVHEYLHYWLNSINPLINNDATVEELTKSIMTSPEFQKILGGAP